MCLREAACALADWFKLHGTPYFFRKSRDPYLIWVLEVMAQQTQLSRAVRYLESWLISFPDLNSLAAAEEAAVLKQWEGLGYYSRARNLLKAARYIVENYAGEFPNTYKSILTLPGVGPYTAAIIASVVFGESVPAVDANVRRVFARFFAKGEPISSKSYTLFCEKQLQQLFEDADPGVINESLMELGEQICCKAQPKCKICPLGFCCQALAAGTVEILPQVEKKESRIKEVYAVCFIKDKAGNFFAYQEQQKNLWRGLWLLPRIKVDKSGRNDICMAVRNFFGSGVECEHVLPVIKHAYTKYQLQFFPVVCSVGENFNSTEYVRVGRNELDDYPFPSGMLKVLRAVFAC